MEHNKNERKEEIEVRLNGKRCTVTIYVQNSEELLQKYPAASKVLLLAEQLQSIRERAQEFDDIYIIHPDGFIEVIAQIKGVLPKTEIIAFANFPLPVQRAIFHNNGIGDSTLRGQLSAYKDRFETEEGTGNVLLKAEHFERVRTEVIPTVRQQQKK